MGRPTIEKKDKTVKLRLSDEMYTELMKRGENVSETIRECIRDSFAPQKETLPIGNVPQKKLEDTLTTLVNRCKDEEVAAIFGSARYEEVTIIRNEDIVPQKETIETPKSHADKLIEEDARAFGLETEDFKLKLIEAVDNGKLMYESGEFLGVGAVDTSRFMERCAELGMNPQDTINKITQRLG